MQSCHYFFVFLCARNQLESGKAGSNPSFLPVFTGCVTLDKLLNFSQPVFLSLK